MRTNLLLTCLLGLGLHSATALAQPFKTIYTALLAAVKSQPLVVLLPAEDPQELRRLADKPAELAQYKAYVAFHNEQLRQLVPKFWELSPSIEFQSQAELPVLSKDKQHATLVLYAEQSRVAYTNGFSTSYGHVNTKLYVDLIGGRLKVFTLSAPVPADAMTAADIVSALRYLQLQVKEEQLATTYTEYNRQKRVADRAKHQEYAQRLRTKTLLLDKASLRESFTEAEFRKVYPYPYRWATPQEIEAAVLTADANSLYARNLSDNMYLLDTADGAQLAAMGQPSTKWGKGEFAVLVSVAK